MVDGEVAALLLVINEPASVGRFARIVEAEAIARIEQSIDLLAEGACLGIEAYRTNAEMYFLVFLRHGFNDGSRAIIERFAIGREGRPCLPITGRRELGSSDDLITCNVEHHGIRAGIENLDALTMMYEERLSYAIGREGDVFGIRMPGRVGNALDGVGKLRIEFLNSSAFD